MCVCVCVCACVCVEKCGSISEREQLCVHVSAPGVCQQPTASDCIATVTLTVPGLTTDVVPPGVVCFNCSIQGMVATNVMYTVDGNDISMDEDMVEAGGILVIFDTDVTFDPTSFTPVRCANDDGFSQTTVLVNGKHVAHTLTHTHTHTLTSSTHTSPDSLSHTVFRPPIVTGNTAINEGDTLDLRCDTSNSFLQPHAQWFNGGGIFLTSSSRLQIEDIDRTGAGMYTCRTNTPNPDDSTNTTVTVVVQCE